MRRLLNGTAIRLVYQADVRRMDPLGAPDERGRMPLLKGPASRWPSIIWAKDARRAPTKKYGGGMQGGKG